jgi:hypothetical protein
MSDLRAEPLSPLDAAALWPQMRRLSTEVLAGGSGENLLLSSGLVATGLTRLPRMPRTIVVGVRRGLGYRGVLIARDLAGGAAWEAVSMRIARDKDDEAVTALVSGVGWEVAQRRGRVLFLRYPDGTTHGVALRRGGVFPYRLERLYGFAGRGGREDGPLRPATSADRHNVFRLYCRAVPEQVRRAEAATLHEWRAVLDSYGCAREYVLESANGLAAWVGIGERECRLFVDVVEGAADAALDLLERVGPRVGTLVLGEDQLDVERNAASRGYAGLGVRVVCSRRLGALNPLKEVVAVPAESLALPQ